MSTSSVQNFINIHPKVPWKSWIYIFWYIYNVYDYIFFKWIPKIGQNLENSKEFKEPAGARI